MEIGIVGLGAVGSAIKQGFEYIGHTTKGHDILLSYELWPCHCFLGITDDGKC